MEYSNINSIIKYEKKYIYCCRCYENNEKIKAKIIWMIKYFNFWFTKYEYRLMNQQKITDEDIEKALW